MLGGEDITGSREEGETRVNVEDHEGSQTREDKEVESEEERVDEQDVEDNVGSEEGLEGRLEGVGEENVDGRENAESDKDDDEKGDKDDVKKGEEDDGEKESLPFDGEEDENQTVEEESEKEIILLDDVETDDQEAPRDERSTRRQFRWSKKEDDEALASRAKRLRLEDIEETEETIPYAKETLAAKKDLSSEALETRYEAERKRKGKHTTKP